MWWLALLLAQLWRKQPWRSTKSIASKASVWSGVLWSIFPLRILDKENPAFQGVSRQTSFHGTNAMCNFEVFGMMCQHCHLQYIVFSFPFSLLWELRFLLSHIFEWHILSHSLPLQLLFVCCFSCSMPKTTTRAWQQIWSRWKLRRHWSFCDNVYPSAFH